MGFEQELKIITRAYNQAQQGLQSTSQGIENIAKSALNAAAASAKLNTAFEAAVLRAEGYKRAANGLILPMDHVTESSKRAAVEVRKAGDESRKGATGLKEQEKGAKGAGDAIQDFYQTIGSLGVLRGFQVAMTGILNVTREFGATAKQASIVSEDFTGALARQAMAATEGIYGPTQLASAYREIGAAGLTAREVLAGTPEVLDYATAAMIDQADAAQGVIAAASSFKIPFTEADRITDAFAEAMNRTTLGGRDLTYALASIGPVAGMAGQGLGETLAAVAALRNAGAQAQDAATSVRAAMLHLSAPSDEAAQMMADLEISVFDAQGQMKQWSAIVAEFEQALAPYNQQARQMALTTILGSDGIRAMATSMQYGSDRLETLAGQFENAEGAADRMASAMEETLDGSIRRVNGNLERAAIVIGQDLQPAFVSVLGFIDQMVVGFVNLDDGTRKMVERIIGGAGLVVALGSVARVVQLLSPGFTSLIGVLGRMGPVLHTVNVGARTLNLTLGTTLGILGLVYAAAGLLYGAWRTYKEGQEQASLAGAEHAKELSNQADRIRDLRTELHNLQAKITPTADEQDRMKQITAELVQLAPEAAIGIDQMTGEIEDMGRVVSGTDAALERLLGRSRLLAEGAAITARQKLPGLKERMSEIEAETEALMGSPEQVYSTLWQESGFWKRLGLDLELSAASREKDLKILQERAATRLSELLTEAQNLQAEIDQLEQTAALADKLSQPMPDDFGYLDPRNPPEPKPPKKRDEGKNLPSPPPSWISQWKSGLEETLAPLDAHTQKLSKVGGELDILSAKQAYYLDLLEDGKAGVEAVTAIEKARADQITQLRSRQEELHQANESYRAMLTTLEAKQKDLDSLLASGKIEKEDHAQATKTLAGEIRKLNDDIYQNSAAWWRDEQAIASAEAAAGRAAETLAEARRKLNDDLYQKANATMRHEIAMRRLSTDQQIALIRQMLSEMTLSTEQTWALQEQLVGLYGEKIEQEADRIQMAYEKASEGISDNLERTLSDIDRRLQDTIGPLKAELEALEGEERSNDRTRAQGEHERRLAELQKQRRYHELRTGREHQEALQQIDQQITEENRTWQEQQQDWALDDRKRAIQDQIDEAEEGAKKEREQAQKAAGDQRKDLKEHYDKVKKITEDGILETIAALAATNPEWFSTGQGLIDQLITGLESGDFSTVLAQIDAVRTAAEAARQAAESVTGTRGSAMTGASAGVPSVETVLSLIAAGKFTEAAGLLASSQGMTYEQAKKNVESYLGRDIPGFASGAWRIPYDGMLAELHKGETVLPAYAAETFRSFGPTLANLPGAIAEAAQQIVQAILSRPAGNVNVYGAQNAYLEDPVDVDMLSRSAAREVTRLYPIGGQT